MARKSNKTDLAPLPPVDDVALEQNRQATAAEIQRLMEIDATYGDGLPYDSGRLIHETQFYLQQSAAAMLEAGKRLILIKEHEQHGTFTQALDQIGIAPRAAQKMMQAAAKFSGAKAPLTAHLSKTKMLELLTEDDADLEALAEGGTLAGHTLDEIERMTAAELREALRKERANLDDERETHEQLLAKKNQKVDELHKKLHAEKKRAKPWNARAFDISQESTNHAFTALQGMDQLNVMRDVILTEEFGEDGEAALPAMARVYHHAVLEVFKEASRLLAASEEVFVGYVDEPAPLLDLADVFGAQADEPADA